MTLALCCSSSLCHSGFGFLATFWFVWSRNWASVVLVEFRKKLENSSKLILASPSTSMRLMIA